MWWLRRYRQLQDFVHISKTQLSDVSVLFSVSALHYSNMICYKNLKPKDPKHKPHLHISDFK